MMFCISLHFKKADLKIRESVSLTKEILSEVKQGVFLETCNRLELYGTEGLYQCVERYFANVKQYILIYESEKAIRHLFRVTSGLDSLVIGEDEILGQVKDAFLYSQNHGFTNYELNTVFKAAITCAKKIKTDTLLSKSSVSVATLAANVCRKYRDGRKTVLIIGGSGDTGSKVIKDLVSIGEFDIFATVREHSIKHGVQTIAYRDRYQYLNRADIVISATKSPHFTITKDRIDGKSRLYIDLAVPRDIDTAIENVVTMDDLKAVAKHNNDMKQNEIAAAENIIDTEIDGLLKELALHRIIPLRVSEELKHFIYDFRSYANAEEFRAFCRVIERMENAE